MWRRWLIRLAALALWLVASPARAQQPVPVPSSETAPAAPAVPVAGPAADAPPAFEAAPNVVAPVPPTGEARVAPSPPLPFVVEPPTSPARGSIGRRWWFWAALGAAAVGLVVAAIAISPGDPYVGNANPGVVSPTF